MPQHRCHSLSSSSWGRCPSAVWLLTLRFFAGLLNHSCSWSVYIMCGCVPLFLTIYPVQDQNSSVDGAWLSCAMALGDFHSRFRSPTVAMHLILFHYNSSEWLVLPFIFPVRKFLDSEVTDHMKVPCMLPSTRAMMIAEMNMPASMYNKSM